MKVFFYVDKAHGKPAVVKVIIKNGKAYYELGPALEINK